MAYSIILLTVRLSFLACDLSDFKIFPSMVIDILSFIWLMYTKVLRCTQLFFRFFERLGIDAYAGVYFILHSQSYHRRIYHVYLIQLLNDLHSDISSLYKFVKRQLDYGIGILHSKPHILVVILSVYSYESFVISVQITGLRIVASVTLWFEAMEVPAPCTIILHVKTVPACHLSKIATRNTGLIFPD